MNKDKKVKNPVWFIFNTTAVLTLLIALAKTFGLFSISWWIILSPLLVVSSFTLFVGIIYTIVEAALDKFKKELLKDLDSRAYVLINESADNTIEALARAHEAMKESK